MFTGIVEEIGTIKQASAGQLTVLADKVLEGSQLGDKKIIEFGYSNGMQINIIEPKEFFLSFMSFNERVEKNSEIRLLFLPGTGLDQEICQWAIKNQIFMINSPQLTSLFRSRWISMNIIQEHYNKLFQNIQNANTQRIYFPESWFITKKGIEDRFGLEYTEKDLLNIIHNSQFLMLKRDPTHISPHLTSKLSISTIITKNTLRLLIDKIPEQKAVLQEYIPSLEGKVVKVYSIGENIWSFIQSEDDGVINEPTSENFEKLSINYPKQEKIRESLLTDQVLIDFSRFLNSKIGLQLFGFDAIQTAEGKYYIVDINDFPGYAGIQDAASKIVNLLQHSGKNRI